MCDWGGGQACWGGGCLRRWLVVEEEADVWMWSPRRPSRSFKSGLSFECYSRKMLKRIRMKEVVAYRRRCALSNKAWFSNPTTDLVL